jgi:hypothetical protein
VSKKMGYGQVRIGAKVYRAHRVAWEHERGPIPADAVIDHLCRVPGCVNPDHMRVVTQRENVLAGESPWALNARKTHCFNGHEFTPENTFWQGNRRRCRECRRIYRARRRLEGKS